LKVVPVIDVLNGVAVHAVRGQREKYQSIESVLFRSPDPVTIASVFKSLGFDSLYLADLDAIQHGSANYGLYNKIRTKTNIELMIDAGISDSRKAEKIIDVGASKIVIGTETLDDLAFVKESVESFGANYVIVSIDLKEGKLLSVSNVIRSMDPLTLAFELDKIGVTKVIILDLARVGAESGVDKSLMQSILYETQLEVFVGGGIRNIRDLEELKDIGLSGALVATALHTGKLTVEELKSGGFM
jgi:phosphoribosylformimino-5-aminoimidazole carboxamide ribotide isomerase